MKTESRPNLFGYLLLGLLFGIGPFFWEMDVGDRVLSSPEAWEAGFAQIIVIMGAVLFILAAFLWRGALWPRWLIVVWCPFSILANIGWSIVMGIGEINPIEVGVVGLPVMLFWVWATWRHLFVKAQ
jgi:hypothetical protein